MKLFPNHCISNGYNSVYLPLKRLSGTVALDYLYVILLV